MRIQAARLRKLIKRDYLLYDRPLGLGYLGLVILIVGIVTINIMSQEQRTDMLSVFWWFNTYMAFLTVGGFLFTSIVFWEFGSSSGRIDYLALPATHTEKLLTRFFYSAILYPVLLIVTFAIVYLVASPIDGPKSETYSLYDAIFNDLRMPGAIFSEIWAMVLVGYTFVFMMAIWLNKYVAAKSAIIGLLIITLFAFLVMVIFRIVFSDLFMGTEMIANIRIEPKPEFQNEIEDKILLIIKAGSITLSVFLLVVSYFKMKEKEV